MKKILIWVVVGIVSLSVLLLLFGSSGTQKQVTTIESTENKATHISKELFDVYRNIFVSLEDLQDEYEQMYAKYGYIEFGEAADIKEEDWPKYGSLTQKITSVRDTIPKINTSMSPEERDLSLNLSAYGTSLIFLSPGKDGLKSLDAVTEDKATVEGIFSAIKQQYGY